MICCELIVTKQKRGGIRPTYLILNETAVMQSKEIWISWHVSQRSSNLAEDLGLPILVKVIENNPLSRHLFSSIWTIYILLKLRPEKIYLQYSFLLLLVLAGYKNLAPYTVSIICDCHTKALRRSIKGGIGKIFWWIKKKSFQSVSMGIVSNVEMVPDITKLTMSYCVLPDKIPDVKANTSTKANATYCVFVCSYAVDEPLDDVIATASRLNGSIRIYCTGKIPRKLTYLKANPHDNITFTDYLSQNEYNDLVTNADCILALTSEEGCLQCAGYEALSAEVPMVLSDTTALRAYFEGAAIYVNHDAHDLENGIRQAVNNRVELLYEILRVKKVREHEYTTALKTLKRLI